MTSLRQHNSTIKFGWQNIAPFALMGRVGAPESDYVLPAKAGFVGKNELALFK